MPYTLVLVLHHKEKGHYCNSLASQGGKTPIIQFGMSFLIFTLHSSQDEVLKSQSLLTVDPFVKIPTSVETIHRFKENKFDITIMI